MLYFQQSHSWQETTITPDLTPSRVPDIPCESKTAVIKKAIVRTTERKTPFIGLGIIAFLTGASAYGGGSVAGKIATETGKMIDNAVIYIDKIPGRTFKAPMKHAQMDQRKLTFIPHVLPILVGTAVDFLNSDDVLHNVFTPDKCGERFNLGSWPNGVVRSFTFKKPGCSAVMLCSIHPDMEAYIVVLETPYFAVSGKDGSYEIRNVPMGKYDLKIWHKLLKGSSLTIQVPDKGVVTADFELKR